MIFSSIFLLFLYLFYDFWSRSYVCHTSVIHASYKPYKTAGNCLKPLIKRDNILAKPIKSNQNLNILEMKTKLLRPFKQKLQNISKTINLLAQLTNLNQKYGTLYLINYIT